MKKFIPMKCVKPVNYFRLHELNWKMLFESVNLRFIALERCLIWVPFFFSSEIVDGNDKQGFTVEQVRKRRTMFKHSSWWISRHFCLFFVSVEAFLCFLRLPWEFVFRLSYCLLLIQQKYFIKTLMRCKRGLLTFKSTTEGFYSSFPSSGKCWVTAELIRRQTGW